METEKKHLILNGKINIKKQTQEDWWCRGCEESESNVLEEYSNGREGVEGLSSSRCIVPFERGVGAL